MGAPVAMHPTEGTKKTDEALTAEMYETLNPKNLVLIMGNDKAVEIRDPELAKKMRDPAAQEEMARLKEQKITAAVDFIYNNYDKFDALFAEMEKQTRSNPVPEINITGDKLAHLMKFWLASYLEVPEVREGLKEKFGGGVTAWYAVRNLSKTYSVSNTWNDFQTAFADTSHSLGLDSKIVEDIGTAAGYIGGGAAAAAGLLLLSAPAAIVGLIGSVALIAGCTGYEGGYDSTPSSGGGPSVQPGDSVEVIPGDTTEEEPPVVIEESRVFGFSTEFGAFTKMVDGTMWAFLAEGESITFAGETQEVEGELECIAPRATYTQSFLTPRAFAVGETVTILGENWSVVHEDFASSGLLELQHESKPFKLIIEPNQPIVVVDETDPANPVVVESKEWIGSIIKDVDGNVVQIELSFARGADPSLRMSIDEPFDLTEIMPSFEFRITGETNEAGEAIYEIEKLAELEVIAPAVEPGTEVQDEIIDTTTFQFDSPTVIDVALVPGAAQEIDATGLGQWPALAEGEQLNIVGAWTEAGTVVNSMTYSKTFAEPVPEGMPTNLFSSTDPVYISLYVDGETWYVDFQGSELQFSQTDGDVLLNGAPTGWKSTFVFDEANRVISSIQVYKDGEEPIPAEGLQIPTGIPAYILFDTLGSGQQEGTRRFEVSKQ